jgi:hypothetical protein
VIYAVGITVHISGADGQTGRRAGVLGQRGGTSESGPDVA